MKKLIFFLLIAASFYFSSSIMARGNEEEKIPPGMEIQQIAGSRLLVPKGAQIHKKGDLIILETANEYVARKLSDIEERLAKIEAEQKKLNERLEQISKTTGVRSNKQ